MFAATPGQAEASGLLVADGGLGGRLEILDHRASVTINNGIALTEVDQVFLNTESRVVEALYMFPVPEGASVANFSMWINGTEMVGEVLEKERAREIYESYKVTRKDPGLLEQVDHKTFEMRIFPIPAGAEQRVRISYTQELEFDHDRATYVYPLATEAVPGIDTRVNGTFEMSVRVLSEVPITEMSSPSHPDDAVIAQMGDGLREASIEQEEGDLARDVVITYATKRPMTGVDVVTSKPTDEDGYFMMTVTAGAELEGGRDAMDYVFLLDVSGSMASDGKLMMSKGAIGTIVGQLSPEDRFEVITFNIRPSTLFGELRVADDASLAELGAFIEGERGRGGTNLLPAVQAAYRYADPDRALNVVILSDGMTEQSERETLLRAGRERPANATLFAVGVGNEVDRPLLSQLTEEAGGLAAFLSRGDDLEQKARAFRRKLTMPAGRDVALRIDGVEVYDVEPKTLPALYHGKPVRLYGRYRGGGEAEVRVEMDVLGSRSAVVSTIELPTRAGGSPEVERMWALRRVERLLRDADRGGGRSRVAEEIVRLGEAYSIVTEYTSFLVLENDAEYRRWRIDRRNATRLERDRAARERVNDRLRELRDEALSSVGPTPGFEREALEIASPLASREARTDPGFAPTTTSSSRDSGGGQGGGAIDPVTGLLLLAGCGASVSRRRRDEA